MIDIVDDNPYSIENIWFIGKNEQSESWYLLEVSDNDINGYVIGTKNYRCHSNELEIYLHEPDGELKVDNWKYDGKLPESKSESDFFGFTVQTDRVKYEVVLDKDIPTFLYRSFGSSEKLELLDLQLLMPGKGLLFNNTFVYEHDFPPEITEVSPVFFKRK